MIQSASSNPVDPSNSRYRFPQDYAFFKVDKENVALDASFSPCKIVLHGINASLSHRLSEDRYKALLEILTTQGLRDPPGFCCDTIVRRVIRFAVPVIVTVTFAASYTGNASLPPRMGDGERCDIPDPLFDSTPPPIARDLLNHTNDCGFRSRGVKDTDSEAQERAVWGVGLMIMVIEKSVHLQLLVLRTDCEPRPLLPSGSSSRDEYYTGLSKSCYRYGTGGKKRRSTTSVPKKEKTLPPSNSTGTSCRSAGG